ncbi:MAG TPA: CbiX/SirB N-terminal domain-containing protein [Candidatus Binatia bacterium]|jgi:sirohydrochlorin ferrochelatase
MESEGPVALVIVDHGSRVPASNAALDDVVATVSARCGSEFIAVLAAHMELASPTIGEAIDAAVRAGAAKVVIALYFLAPGRHSETDVPALAAEAAARHPGLTVTVTACLGPDPLLADLVARRARSAPGANRI